MGAEIFKSDTSRIEVAKPAIQYEIHLNDEQADRDREAAEESQAKGSKGKKVKTAKGSKKQAKKNHEVVILKFQEGPIKAGEPRNGLTTDEVIEILIERETFLAENPNVTPEERARLAQINPALKKADPSYANQGNPGAPDQNRFLDALKSLREFTGVTV